MNHNAPARAETRRAPRLVLAGLAVVIAAIIGTLGYQSASSAAPSFSEVLRGDHDGTTTEDDGVLPDGVTVFDDQYPGVANLDPDLLPALREAATDAADDGFEFYVNSGWRSAEYQDQLLREAVTEYGSEEEAARGVATADTSAHVSGDAVAPDVHITLTTIYLDTDYVIDQVFWQHAAVLSDRLHPSVWDKVQNVLDANNVLATAPRPTSTT